MKILWWAKSPMGEAFVRLCVRHLRSLSAPTNRWSNSVVGCSNWLCERCLRELKGPPILFSRDVVGRADKAEHI